MLQQSNMIYFRCTRLFGMDSKTGFNAVRVDYYITIPTIVVSKNNRWHRVDSTLDPNLWIVTSDLKFARILENDVMESGTDPCKYFGDNNYNSKCIAASARLVME